MMLESERSTFRDCLETWGEQSQFWMLFEEMAELQQALVGRWRHMKHVSLHDIATELADVGIMLDQMAVLFDIEDEVQDERTLKIDRLDKLLLKANEKETDE